MSPSTPSTSAARGRTALTLPPGPALECADNVITFRSVVKMMAARNGLWAAFSPKPIPDQAGNGFRIAMRPTQQGESCADAFLAGVLERFPGDAGVLQSPGGILRAAGAPLGRRPRSSWADTGRGALLRRKADGRLELSAADGAANPYLAFSLLIYAGVDGGTAGPLPRRAGNRPAFGSHSGGGQGPVQGERLPAGAAAQGDSPCLHRALRARPRTAGCWWPFPGRKNRAQWERLLGEEGFREVAFAASGGEARRLLLAGAWDAVVVSAPLPDEFGHQLAMDAAEEGPGVLLAVKSDQWEEVNARVAPYGVLTLGRPFSPGNVLPGGGAAAGKPGQG